MNKEKVALGVVVGGLLGLALTAIINILIASNAAAAGFFHALSNDTVFWILVGCALAAAAVLVARAFMAERGSAASQSRMGPGLAGLIGGSAIVIMASSNFIGGREAPKPLASKPENAWRYSTKTDALRGYTHQIATVRSDKPILVGSREAWVYLEVDAKESLSITLSSDVLRYCHNDWLVLRLDNGPLEYGRCFQTNSLPHGSALILPLVRHDDKTTPTESISKRLRHTTQLVIEVPTRGGGAQQVSFSTKNLGF